jgi:hypothetical protein
MPTSDWVSQGSGQQDCPFSELVHNETLTISSVSNDENMLLNGHL